MSEQEWSWVLFVSEIVGVIGAYLTGKRKWYGWGIILASSFAWFSYAIIFNKPAFIAIVLMLWVVNTKNMVNWFKDDKGKKGTP